VQCREYEAGSRFPRIRRRSRNLDGKEGVDGSSPSEGFTKEEIPANGGFVVASYSTTEHLCGQLPDRVEPARLLESPCKSARRAASRSTSTNGREARLRVDRLQPANGLIKPFAASALPSKATRPDRGDRFWGQVVNFSRLTPSPLGVLGRPPGRASSLPGGRRSWIAGSRSGAGCP
jgi:hypothetical protein